MARYARGMSGAEWWEDDAFWEELEGVMFDAERMAAAAGEAERVVALAGAAPGCAVLDLPCGPGRHALELARRGFRVTGVDRSELYLGRARARAAELGLAPELVRGDMRTFSRSGAFDLALSLYSSLGYFAEEGENRAVLARFHENLRPGGVLVVDVKARRSLEEGQRVLDSSLGPIVEHTALTGALATTTWTFEREGRRVERSFRLRVYDASELRALLEEVGFGDVALHDGLAARTNRLVAVARR